MAQARGRNRTRSRSAWVRVLEWLDRCGGAPLPGLVAKRFDGLLDDMRDDGYANVSYKVFDIGEANHLPAYSMELGVGLENGRHIECIDRLLEIAAERRKRERLVHTSPIALGFVGPSRAFASMMHERLADLGVRPHWGQINSPTPERVAQLYPRWPEWLAVERRFNASGRVRLALHRARGDLEL